MVFIAALASVSTVEPPEGSLIVARWKGDWHLLSANSIEYTQNI
jgi:hypothetical protein